MKKYKLNWWDYYRSPVSNIPLNIGLNFNLRGGDGMYNQIISSEVALVLKMIDPNLRLVEIE